MPTKVEAKNIYKVFGKSPERAMESLRAGQSKAEILEQTEHVVGVDDVSFSVEEGEIFIAMGLSGSGKSTLIRCINRLIEPTSGQMLIDGEDIMQASPEQLRKLRRSRFAMVFQHFALFPHRTVRENVEYGLKVQGVDRNERRESALETLVTVGLEGWADRYPENLSGGMRQRVGLARALVTGADILLMDEAFSALDPLIRRDMQDELISLQQTLKKTIIFITHDLHEALKLGDHIAVMKDGRIVQIGTPQEIVAEPADRYVQAFTHDVDRGKVFTVSSVMHPAEPLRLGHDSVRTAMYRMRDYGRDALYVIDRAGTPVGVVFHQEIGQAVRQGDGVSIEQIMHNDFPSAAHATPLADVYGICASGWPVAVLDDRGRLEGVVNQFDVLTSLAVPPQPDGEVAEPEGGESPAPAMGVGDGGKQGK
ncbi:MAG: glycine betaine/L-proline ABC transporter ATP-binding protein [Dehalococcoidia bacterium]